jgi:excisionase family DNA binding protein
MMLTRVTPASQLPELLRIDECAAWLDCGSATVRGMVQRGELPSIRLGRLLRIPRAGLLAMVGARAIDVAS